MKVKDVVNFIRVHDKKGILAHWNDTTLCLFIKKAIDEQAFFFYTEDSKLIGIAFGRWRPNNVMHVEYMLTLRNCLCKFILHFQQLFPDAMLIAIRHNKLRNLTKLVSHYAKSK